MQLTNLIQYMKLSKSKMVVVDCELCKDYLGYVRTITIMEETLVKIEFDVYNYDEAGLTYFIKYENFELLIKSLEEYLEKKLDEWEIINVTGYYPERPLINYDINKTHKIIKHDLIYNKIKLPNYGHIQIKEGYWKDIYDKKIK